MAITRSVVVVIVESNQFQSKAKSIKIRNDPVDEEVSDNLLVGNTLRIHHKSSGMNYETNLQILSRIVKSILFIVATSSDPEIHFPSSEKIGNPERSRLREERFYSYHKTAIDILRTMTGPSPFCLLNKVLFFNKYH